MRDIWGRVFVAQVGTISQECCGKKGKQVKTFIDHMANDEEDFEEEDVDTKEIRVAELHVDSLETVK